MIFDSKEHQDLVKALIESSTFPGKLLYQIHSLSVAVHAATVQLPEVSEERHAPERGVRPVRPMP